jgi:predicted permease
MNDFHLALRQLRRTPVFTTIAVLSIALGIGATTSVFTLLDAFLLRSLPVLRPDELVLFRAVHGANGRMSRRGEGPGLIDPATGRNSGTPLPLVALERFRAQGALLSEVFGYSPFSQVNVAIDGVPETTVSAQFVSGNYYAGLGVGAVLGRTLTIDDDRVSAPPVVVISHRFWQGRFDADPTVLGRTVSINRVATTVVGVTPAGFEGALQIGETADVSVPLNQHARFQPERAERAQPWYWWVRIMGRLASGATAARARAELEPIFQVAAREGWLAAQAIERSGPMPDLPLLAVDPGAQGENDVRRQYARSLYMLMGLVGVVLLAACANVANLLIARGSEQRRTVALRLALGASRRRIVRLLLAESLLIAFAGAALGVVFAWWGRDLLLALRPFGNTQVILDLPLDGRVLAFTLTIATTTALVFGLLPALRTSRVDLTMEFQGGPRTLGGTGRSRAGQAFMVLQVALSLVLLVCMGLFARTLRQLDGVDAGFDIRDLALFRVDAVSAGYSLDRWEALHDQIAERLAALPGAASVTYSRVAPLSRTRQNMTFSIPGRTPPSGVAMITNTNGLAVNFFDAMALPLVRGRGFTESDHAGAPTVCVVNQTFARTYFGEEDPVGRSLVFSAPNFRRTVAIVGVARDAKYTDLRGATPATVYFSVRQQPDGAANFAVRTAGDPAALLPAIRAAVREIDPALPVLNLRTQREQIERLHGQERLFARLSGFFGLTTLVLACIGLYGLLSHAVALRDGEIGLRIALGATPRQVRDQFVGEALALVCTGIVLGLGAAYAGGRLVATMLFDVSPTDPRTYAMGTFLLIATTLLSSFIPAHRASRIAPLDSLRGRHY